MCDRCTARGICCPGCAGPLDSIGMCERGCGQLTVKSHAVPDASGLTHAELLDIAGVLADMIDGEWPGPLSYSVSTWGSATPEQLVLVGKLEAYLDSRRQ